LYQGSLSPSYDRSCDEQNNAATVSKATNVGAGKNDNILLKLIICILNQMSKDYNLKISTDKTKIMAFKGKHLVHAKIEVDGSILEQVKQFNYLECELSLDGEPDFDKKINRFQRICGTIRKHPKNPYRHPNEICKVVA
jgi:hypothetical protein